MTTVEEEVAPHPDGVWVREQLEHQGKLHDELTEAGLHPKYVNQRLAYGIYVDYPLYPWGKVYVYALPFARGWVVYVDDRFSRDVFPTDRFTVESRWYGLSHTFYCERGSKGPWLVPITDIANKVYEYINTLCRMNVAKRNKYIQEHWPRAMYWYLIDRTQYSLEESDRHDVPWLNHER